MSSGHTAVLCGTNTQSNSYKHDPGANITGDVTVAMLRGVKTQHHDDEEKRLRILTKNVFSLQNDERLEELMTELREIDWDIVVITETWRDAKEENVVLADGHRFLGSGGTVSERGVAVIVHSRWSNGVQGCQAVSERLMAVEVDIWTHKFTLIATYMPHSGYDAVAVEEVYAAMSTLHNEARRKHRITVFAGDWNAVLGTWKPGDDAKVLGNHGLGPRNCRGQWMTIWATLERFLYIFFGGSSNPSTIYGRLPRVGATDSWTS